MLAKKLLIEILKNQKEIKALLNPKTLEKAKKYDELEETVKDVKFNLKSTRSYVDENGMDVVSITYEPITEIVVVTDNDVISSSRFKAINKLNLISLSDMRKISAAIEKTKKVKQ